MAAVLTPEGTGAAPTPDVVEFDAQHYRSDFITHSDIVAMGYTPAYIRRFLGEPDRRARNERGRYSLRLYNKQRARLAFATPEAKAAAQKMAHRRRLRDDAAERRFDLIVCAIDDISVTVRKEAPERLRRASYEWLKHHIRNCRFTHAYAVALLNETFVDRREYAYVRHMLTQFEFHMRRFENCKPRAPVARAVVSHFNRQIVDHYPYLRNVAYWAADMIPCSCVGLGFFGGRLKSDTYNFGRCCQ